MAVNKYLHNNAGTLTEQTAPVTSGGATDAGKLPALDANGRLALSFMPTGIGADTNVVVASEALTAGDLVNVFNNAGTANCRKADASTTTKRAHGFVLAAVTNGGNATIFGEGTNDQQTGLTAGDLWLSAATPGKATATPPTGSGNLVQRVGVAVSATAFNFEADGNPIALA